MGNLLFRHRRAAPVQELPPGVVAFRNDPLRIAELAELNEQGIQALGRHYELIELSDPQSPTPLEKLWLVLKVASIKEEEAKENQLLHLLKEGEDEGPDEKAVRGRVGPAKQVAHMYGCKEDNLYVWMSRHKKQGHTFGSAKGGRVSNEDAAKQREVASLAKGVSILPLVFLLYSVSK